MARLLDLLSALALLALLVFLGHQLPMWVIIILGVAIGAGVYNRIAGP